MKFLFLILFFLAPSTFAEAPIPLHVVCKIQELVDDVTAKETTVDINSTSQPHGAILFPKLEVISDVELMIALYDGLLILNFHHQATGITVGSHADITGGKNAHGQMHLGQGRSLTVNCIKE